MGQMAEGGRVTDPRAFWCPCCGWKLPGLLTIPFVQKCPKCRRTVSVGTKDGELTLRVALDSPTA